MAGFYPKGFSERLQAARQRRDMTQAQLAGRAEINATTIAHYETGSRLPGAANLRDIARALDINTDFLLGLSDRTDRIIR